MEPRPAPSERKTCRSCGAPILWVETDKGKAMPLDADPRPDGNVVIATGSGKAVVLSKKGAQNISQEQVHYTSHFATCPDADAFRR